MRRLTKHTALVVLTLVLTAGCGLLPESGPVHRTSGGRGVVQDGDARFSAPGPAPGDPPVAIVNGFLQAMTANPATTSVARSYLSREAAASWTPTRSTIVYTSAAVSDAPGLLVRARLSEPRALDSRGGWLGTVPTTSGDLTMQMVREDGQWRIADPPDELLVPAWFLQQRYQPYNLYFFDQTARVLVPDRVYVPRGEQVPSQLVRALLNGPGESLSAVTRTEFPEQTQLNLSVVVGPDGTAEIPFSGAAGAQLAALPPQRLARAAAQLAWTLRQVPGVTRLRMAVGDTPLTLPDGRRTFSVQTGAQYAPSVVGARKDLYGIRRGRLVTEAANGDEQPAPGVFGLPGFALRSFAVRLDGGAIAAVTGNGRSVFVDRHPSLGLQPRRVYVGTDVLRPAYDMFGTLWWVDAQPAGARVFRMVHGQPTELTVPGITGTTVRSFLVGRDGTSLVAIVGGSGGDRVVSAGVRRDDDGDVVHADLARRIGEIPTDLRDLRDVVWRSPNDLAVLGRLPNGVFDVIFVSLDGSPGDPRTVPPDTWRGQVTGLVGAPDSTLPLYLVLDGGQLLRLDDSSRWRASGIAKGLLAPTYVG